MIPMFSKTFIRIFSAVFTNSSFRQNMSASVRLFKTYTFKI